MNVLLVEPGKKPREAEIGLELDALKAVGGGNIEAVYPWDEPAALGRELYPQRRRVRLARRLPGRQLPPRAVHHPCGGCEDRQRRPRT